MLMMRLKNAQAKSEIEEWHESPSGAEQAVHHGERHKQKKLQAIGCFLLLTN
jgi:hypothetical protein